MPRRDKMVIRIEPLYNKLWFWVIPRDGRFIPAFEDWYRQIIVLIYLERLKYPHLDNASDLPLQFFCDAFQKADALLDKAQRHGITQGDDHNAIIERILNSQSYNKSWDELRLLHRIPKR